MNNRWKREKFNKVFIIIITILTNYDSDKSCFDTKSVKYGIEQVYKINLKLLVVLKSTIQVGFTK